MFRFIIGLLFICLYSLEATSQDTPMPIQTSEDSVRYLNLKRKMSKTKFTRRLYKFAFRDVYNQGKKEQVRSIDENSFNEYEGLIIGDITVKQLDVLGTSIYDSTRKGNGVERFLSTKVHSNTREKIIRSYFLFDRGDPLNPQVLRDNERIIRNNPTILDVRFIVIPRTDPSWMADIVVLIQDRWSIRPSLGISGPTNLKLGINNTNFLGSATNFNNSVRWNARDSIQIFQTRTTYSIPYIGKSFITAYANLIWERELKQRSIGFSRPFLTTNMRYAGAFEMGQSRILELKRPTDDPFGLLRYEVKYNYYDAWLGRAFKLPILGLNKIENARFVTALRLNQYRYTDRPEVRADTNKLYWNRRTALMSLGVSNRYYKRDVLIYDFGRTEDVPTGNMASITFGTETTEFGTRGYGGFQVSRGQDLSSRGDYLYALLSVGSYVKRKELQQGVISGSLDYISPLLRISNRNFRQFVSIKYTRGINRDPLEYLNISGKNGIRGIRNDFLIGTERLSLGLESVLFTSKSVVGFRIAYFAFIDASLITRVGKLWNQPVYQGYGIGLRFRNENLAIKTLQMRIAYYPNIPTLNSPIRGGTEGMSRLQFRDFDISAPTIVPLL